MIKIGDSIISNLFIGSTQVSKAYLGNVKVWPITTETNYVTFTAQRDNSSIGLTKLSTNQTLEYSNDAVTWNTFNTSTNISLNIGDKVYVRGKLSANNTSSNYTQFKMSGKIAASGNTNSLWDYEDLNAPLKKYCGYRLFYGCTGLTTSPELPATTLANVCYGSMFYGCSSLTTAPELPATTLTVYCYAYMFYGCSSLTQAPELPATTLANYCYNCMFQNCTSITTAPELLAPTLSIWCYHEMFAGCSNLNYIKCLATDISATDCTTNWVSGVAATGTFVKDPNATSWTIGNNGIPTGWVVKDVDTPYVTFTAQQDNSSIGLTKLSTNQTLEYSTDLSVWNTFNTSTNISLNTGDKVYVRGKLSANNTNSNYTQFKMSGKIAAIGNTNSFWNYEDLTAQLKQYCGYRLFYNCVGLIDTSELTLGTSATVLAPYCYNSMFYSCRSLTTAPELPATTLANSCYEFMFYSCTSLTTAPELPSTTLTNSCYRYMFSNCTSLTIAPELTAATLADYCYSNMFDGCSSLITAPELPSTTLTNSCYNYMLYGCTSLTTAPELPSTTLTNSCYEYMFFNCTNLNYIKCLAVSGINENNSTYGWVSGVASTGTFVKDSKAKWTTGTEGIPSGWTTQDA